MSFLRDFLKNVVGTSPDAAKTKTTEGDATGAAKVLAAVASEFGGQLDLGQVRSHVDGKAAATATQLGAAAYVKGGDIALGGKPGPQAAAHEAVHVMQQPSSLKSAKPESGALGGAPQGDSPEASQSISLVSIKISPELGFIDGGTQRQFSALGTFSDGHTEDLTEMVEWTSSSENVVAIDDSGLASAELMSGTAKITATEPVSGVKASLDVSVSEEAPMSNASGVTVQFAFYAFIPGSLGKSFASFPYPSDLKNQAAFEGMVKGVSGTWLEEPGTMEAYGTGPWLFATDNRGFGGGTHRVGCTGSVSSADVGSLKSKGNLFSHDTSGSERVRWEHTGYLTSSGETGKINGPVSASAGVSSSEKHEDISADESFVRVSGSASYPFALLAPNIDYELVLRFERAPGGKLTVSGVITTNVFPFYELLINGSSAWKFSSSGTGPGVWNLNSSQTSKLSPRTF